MEASFLKNKKVLIMGLGRFGGGKDAAIFAAKAGAAVTITDLADSDKLSKTISYLKEYPNIEYHLGSHQEEDFSDTEILIVNPAVAPENKFIQIAKSCGAVITSQIEIFFQLCKGKIVGITGANGKSTTTSLTAHLLESGLLQKDFAYKKVWLGGNIGNQPMLSIVEQIEENHIVVLEISSFQAEQLANQKLTPAVSLITNLTENHLDRHGTFEAYCAAKENLFKYQNLCEQEPAISIFNSEDEITRGWFDKYKGQKGRICFGFSYCQDSGLIENYSLAGKANLSNLAAAQRICEHFGVTKETIASSLKTFHSLPHRLELVDIVDGVSWYNDSIATTPPSAIAALDAFECPKIIIAGGYDKKLPFDELGEVAAKKAKAAILIGDTAQAIKSCIEKYQGDCLVQMSTSLEEAILLAEKISDSGDAVILSPACASYDMFDNFQQRGERFAQLVRKL